MPVGPIELADQVGLDVALHVARILAAELGIEPPTVLRSLVDAGRLGQKSDKGGFYEYRDHRIVRPKAFAAPDAVLCDRLILTLVNEAARCFDDGVVDDIDLLDAGVVFGTGFAPHTGGPLNYARQCGRDDILERLHALESRLGPRFAPHPALTAILAQK